MCVCVCVDVPLLDVCALGGSNLLDSKSVPKKCFLLENFIIIINIIQSHSFLFFFGEYNCATQKKPCEEIWDFPNSICLKIENDSSWNFHEKKSQMCHRKKISKRKLFCDGFQEKKTLICYLLLCTPHFMLYFNVAHKRQRRKIKMEETNFLSSSLVFRSWWAQKYLYSFC